MRTTILGMMMILSAGCGDDGPSASSDGGTAAKGTPGAQSASCEGDFTLGQTFNHGSELGTACSPKGAPTNCIDGSWIVFGKTGECVCIAACSSFKSLTVGGTCTQDGSWTCQDIKATNASANGGQFCVATSWKLCGSSGGTSSGGTSSGGTSSGGTSSGGTCKSSGAACFDDSECCSNSCSFSKCE